MSDDDDEQRPGGCDVWVGRALGDTESHTMATNDTTLESSTGLTPRVAGVLAYSGWWVTGVVFWAIERRDRFVRFHAAQATAAFGIVSALTIGFLVMAAASLSFLPGAFRPFLWAAGMTWVCGLVLWVVAIWQAAKGCVWRIPLAADLADRWSAT